MYSNLSETRRKERDSAQTIKTASYQTSFVMHIQTLEVGHMLLRGYETRTSHPLVADTQVSFSLSDGHNRDGT
jgi:hypothetical protein